MCHLPASTAPNAIDLSMSETVLVLVSLLALFHLWCPLLVSQFDRALLPAARGILLSPNSKPLIGSPISRPPTAISLACGHQLRIARAPRR